MVRIYCRTYTFPNHSPSVLQAIIESGELFQEQPYDRSTRKGALDYFFQRDTRVVLQDAPTLIAPEKTPSGIVRKVIHENRSLMSLSSLYRSRVQVFSDACERYKAYSYSKILKRMKRYLTKKEARRDL